MRLRHIGTKCCALLLLLLSISSFRSTKASTTTPALLSSFGAYPNPFDLDETDREMFHPVVIFPSSGVASIDSDGEVDNVAVGYKVLDLTTPKKRSPQLATEEEWKERRELYKSGSSVIEDREAVYGVGRYDEDRIGMYESDLFDDLDNSIDGYAGRRTIHVAIDLGGPVGTPVYAFYDGVVHSAGYNPDLGDYGNVVVIEHRLPAKNPNQNTDERVVYALYGHLDDSSIVGKTPGKPISKGEIIGRMGDFHENGGWFNPHVHFQLSRNPPKTHDMPGAVSIADREVALVDYPDPRYILGELY